MSISDIRKDLQGHLAAFLWSVGADGGSRDDQSRRPLGSRPRALLLLTFEVGRDEPRLFDEVLDWLVVNERLISIQRLRNLARDEEDRALIEAVVGWLGERRRRARLEARNAPGETTDPQPFFRNSQLPTADPDPAFLAQGFLKPRSEPSGKAKSPQVLLPINFAFRLRLLLGIGARAETMRALLTIDAPRTNLQVIAASTAYTKRNVQEAASSLTAAGALDAFEISNEQRFSAPRDRWSHFLTLDTLPRHEDWPHVFAAYRKVLRWLADPEHEDLSDYMLSSEARTLSEEVTPDLQFAGVALDSRHADSGYLERFAQQLLERAPV